ncbi:MAG: hypothetical protein U0271_41240 [Polyangiaceae bacterium]
MTSRPIELADLERLADSEAPRLVDAITAFVEEDEAERTEPLPPNAITLDGLRSALRVARKQFGKRQRQAKAHEAWQRYLGQPRELLAPQLAVAELIVALYDKRTAASRAALLEIAREAPLAFGIWGGLKRVFKRAEADLDAEVWGVLAARFDAAANRGSSDDVGRGTLIYLARRAARFLRYLGKASPELYPRFAVEVLRSFPSDAPYCSIPTALLVPRSKKWGAPVTLAKSKKFRAPYLEAWKRSPDPLLLLLETGNMERAVQFATLGLQELFPDIGAKLPVSWLARLADRPVGATHEFFIRTLEASPEYHQSKLAALGLKDAVVKLLASPNDRARKYAIEYARGHAADMPAAELLAFLEKAKNHRDTTAFLVSLVTARPPRALGARVLGQLLQFNSAVKWAKSALDNDIEDAAIDDDFLVDMLFEDDGGGSDWARAWLERKRKPSTTQAQQGRDIPAAFFMRVLDDPRMVADYTDLDDFALKHLQRYPIESIPGDWLLGALARDDIGERVSDWLADGNALPKSIDKERLKGLVFDADKRGVAFALLGNPKLVPPEEVGVGWLLALARRADPALHEWAHRYLLQNVKPAQFSEGKPDADSGAARLFALASGAKEPDPIRQFAQAYLRCHHPKIGRQQPESGQFGVKPSLARTHFTEARVWPCLRDERPDVRKFGVTIARVELRQWGAQARVYELADSSAKEVRNLAYEAIVQAGQPHADPDLALTLDELDAAQIFSMTESRIRSSRDVAMDMIRVHYARIGGAERLGWLMQSADAEVRLFAVRLLWEKHRPRGLPSTWKPPQGALDDAGPFHDAEALRAVLRRLLFMTPPSRSNEKLDEKRSKKVSASVTKRRIVELVRDLGLRDPSFAALAMPVLGEFTGSVAKGEWQACLAALVALRSAHGLAIEEVV